MTRRAGLGVAASLCLLVAASSCTVSECQREVEAAYKKLETSGYRSETLSVVSARRTTSRTVEFSPPDRMHIIDSGIIGPELNGIKIGNRAWYRIEGAWHERPGELGLFTVFMSGPDGRTFACLGPVDYAGKTYAGYRATGGNPKAMASLVPREIALEIESELRQRPQLLETILVDRDTGFLAYEIVAPQNELGQARSRTHYTYPNNITIEPPAR
jgi:hypothetical protein